MTPRFWLLLCCSGLAASFRITRRSLDREIQQVRGQKLLNASYVVADFEAELLGTLGSGGFAVTYLGRDKRTNQLVAIKHLKTGNAPADRVGQLRDAAVKEAENECRMANEAIARSPVSMHQYFTKCLQPLPPDPNATPAMVFEYGGTRTLHDVLFGDRDHFPAGMNSGDLVAQTSAGLYARRQLMKTLTQIVATLGLAELTHHDLKLDNIVVDGDAPHYKMHLIDYGGMRDLRELPDGGTTSVAWIPFHPWWKSQPRVISSKADGIAYDSFCLGMMWVVSEVFPPEAKISVVTDKVNAVLRDVNGWYRGNGTHPTRTPEAFNEILIDKVVRFFSANGWFNWYKPGTVLEPPEDAVDLIWHLLKEHPDPASTLLAHPFLSSISDVPRMPGDDGFNAAMDVDSTPSGEGSVPMDMS